MVVVLGGARNNGGPIPPPPPPTPEAAHHVGSRVVLLLRVVRGSTFASLSCGTAGWTQLGAVTLVPHTPRVTVELAQGATRQATADFDSKPVLDQVLI